MNPLMGQSRPDLQPDLRMFTSGRQAILYLPRSDGIEVVAVVDSAQDVEGMFRRGER